MKQTFKVWAMMMLISVVPIGTLYAQWERFYLSGKVKDISSRMYISDATVEVMTTDSVVLAEKKSLSADNLAMNNNRMVNLSISLKELQHDRLILRFMHPGYTTKYMDIHIQGKRYDIDVARAFAVAKQRAFNTVATGKQAHFTIRYRATPVVMRMQRQDNVFTI